MKKVTKSQEKRIDIQSGISMKSLNLIDIFHLKLSEFISKELNKLAKKINSQIKKDLKENKNSKK